MRITIGLGILTLGLVTSPSAGQDIPNGFAEIDRTFVCPEALPDDAARQRALREFFTATAKANPSETVEQATAYRLRLLQKHACKATLDHMNAADNAVRGGAVLDQAWLEVGRNDIGHISVATTNARLYLDPRAPNGHAVEVYAKLEFAAPRIAKAGHVHYDTVVSHAVYYCRAHAYALIENDYFLDRQPVLKDAQSPEAKVGGIDVYQRTSTPQGSFNAMAEAWACEAVQGSAT